MGHITVVDEDLERLKMKVAKVKETLKVVA